MIDLFILDDDPSLVLLVTKYLGREFNIRPFGNVIDAKNAILENKVNASIFILDEELPDGSGIDLCPMLREKYGNEVFILILTKNSEIDTKLSAYQLGADDYLVKPFEALELSAKLKNVSLRLDNSKNKNFHYKDIFFDFTQMEAFLDNEERVALELTRKEFLILTLLLQNAGSVFNRDKIIKKVWGENTSVTDRTVDQHIAHLRKKISVSKVVIESIRGEGYRVSDG